jgi:hypothetical protein
MKKITYPLIQAFCANDNNHNNNYNTYSTEERRKNRANRQHSENTIILTGINCIYNKLKIRIVRI